MKLQIITPQVELHKIEHEFANTPHAHDDQYQMTVPLRGVCYFRCGQEELRLTAGDGLVLQPRDSHAFHIGDEASVLVIRISDRSLNGAGEAAQASGSAEQPLQPEQRYRFRPEVIDSYFRSWARTFFSLDPADRLAAEETETQVLHDFRRLLADGCAADTFRGVGLEQPATAPIGPAGMGSVRAAAADLHLKRAVEYVHAHYRDQLDVDTLAAVALQSRFHFIRSFRAMTGLTPYQYVLRLRVEEAKVQLSRTAHTVTEISYSLGFSSASQFYRAFAKATGLTPEQYRGGLR